MRKCGIDKRLTLYLQQCSSSGDQESTIKELFKLVIYSVSVCLSVCLSVSLISPQFPPIFPPPLIIHSLHRQFINSNCSIPLCSLSVSVFLFDASFPLISFHFQAQHAEGQALLDIVIKLRRLLSIGESKTKDKSRGRNLALIHVLLLIFKSFESITKKGSNNNIIKLIYIYIQLF